jgi:hypothetical protein
MRHSTLFYKDAHKKLYKFDISLIISEFSFCFLKTPFFLLKSAKQKLNFIYKNYVEAVVIGSKQLLEAFCSILKLFHICILITTLPLDFLFTNLGSFVRYS